MNRGPRDRGRDASAAGGPRNKAWNNADKPNSDQRNGGRPRNNEGRPPSGPRKPMGRAPSEYRVRLERLRTAREPEEIREAVDTFLQHHQLPDDVDILYKVLLHPTEKVVREALGQISSLLIQGRIASGGPLEERLNSLDQRVSEDATRSFVSGVRSQLEKLKKAALAT